MVGSNANKWTILPVQIDGCQMSMALPNVVDTPEFCVRRSGGTRNAPKVALELVPDQVEQNQDSQQLPQVRESHTEDMGTLGVC